MRPPYGCLDPSWVIYTDESLLDGPSASLRGPGWAFVALACEGVERAAASGVPPPWITTIFGSEPWGVLQAVSCGLGPSVPRIDCKSVIVLLTAGWDRVVIPTRLTASAWADIFDAMNRRRSLIRRQASSLRSSLIRRQNMSLATPKKYSYVGGRSERRQRQKNVSLF